LEKTEVRDDFPLPPKLALWDLPQYVDESGSMAKLPLRFAIGTKRTRKTAPMHIRLAGNNGHDANVMRCLLLASRRAPQTFRSRKDYRLGGRNAG
jgi:hypothetical protein